MVGWGWGGGETVTVLLCGDEEGGVAGAECDNKRGMRAAGDTQAATLGVATITPRPPRRC